MKRTLSILLIFILSLYWVVFAFPSLEAFTVSPSTLSEGDKVLVDLGGSYGEVVSVVIVSGESPRLLVAENLAEAKYDNKNNTYSGSDAEIQVNLIMANKPEYITDHSLPTKLEITQGVENGNYSVEFLEMMAFLTADTPLKRIVTNTAGSANDLVWAWIPDPTNEMGEHSVKTRFSIRPAFTLDSSVLLMDSNQDGVYEVVVNESPTISDILNQTTDEDVSIIDLGFVVTDADQDDGTLIVTAESDDQTLLPNENIQLGGTDSNRTITITPASNLSGNATVTVTVTDDIGFTSSDSFIVTVETMNDTPQLSDILNQTTDEDTSISGIIFTTSDVDNVITLDDIEVTSTNQSKIIDENITVTGSNGNWEISITPEANASGDVVINYQVDDGGTNGLIEKSFTLTITEVNDTPTLSDILNKTTDEDTSISGITFTTSDVDKVISLDDIEVTSTNQSKVADENITVTGTNDNWQISIVPEANANGDVVINYQVDDGGVNGLVEKSFTLTITEVNDTPTISSIEDQATTVGVDIDVDVIIGDIETSSSELLLTVSTDNEVLFPEGSLTLSGTNGNRSLNISPASGLTGTATITLAVEDDNFATQETSFEINVSELNNPPTISDILNQTTDEDVSIDSLGFIVSDANQDDGTLIVTAESDNQTLLPDGNIVLGETGSNRTITLTPVDNLSGSAVVTVTVTDDEGVSSSDSFEVEVEAVNDTPILSDISNQTTNEDTVISGITFTTSDVDNVITLSDIEVTSADKSIVDDGGITLTGEAGNWEIEISPEEGASGDVVINYQVDDGELNGLVQKSFTLTITGVNDTPTLSDISNQTTNEDTMILEITFTTSDADNVITLGDIEVTSNDQTKVIDGNISVSGANGEWEIEITPEENVTGDVVINYQVDDGGLNGLVQKSFTLTITAVNDAPVIVSIADDNVNTEDSSNWIPPSTTATDVEDGDITDSIVVTYYLESNILDSISLAEAREYLYSGSNILVEYTVTDSNLLAVSRQALFTSVDNTLPTFDEIDDQEIIVNSSDVDWTTLVNNIVDNKSTIFIVEELNDSVIYNTVGDYTVTIWVTDESSNYFDRLFNVRVFPEQLTISFVSEGELLSSSLTDYNQAVSTDLIPKPQKSGYKFIGWQNEDIKYDKQLSGFLMPNNDLIMTARFEENETSSPPSNTTKPNTVGVKGELLGHDTLVIDYGTEYVDPGYIFTFGQLNINSKVVVTGNVDTNSVGTYNIKYEYIGMYGVASLTREVKVVDNIAPKLTLLGDSYVEIFVGDTYTDPGYTISENTDSIIDVNESGQYDTTQVGRYEINYTAVDESNNTATATRTINVISIPTKTIDMNINDNDNSLTIESKLLSSNYEIYYVYTDRDYRYIDSHEWTMLPDIISLNVSDPGMFVHIKIVDDNGDYEIYSTEELPYVENYIKVTEEEVIVKENEVEAKETTIDSNEMFKEDIVKFQKEVIDDEEIVMVVFDIRERTDISKIKVYYREKTTSTPSLIVSLSAADWKLLIVEEGSMEKIIIPSSQEYEFATEIIFKDTETVTDHDFLVKNDGGIININVETSVESVVEVGNNYFLWLLPSIILAGLFVIYEIVYAIRKKANINNT